MPEDVKDETETTQPPASDEQIPQDQGDGATQDAPAEEAPTGEPV